MTGVVKMRVILGMCFVVLALARSPALADEQRPISVNDLGYIDYLALVISLGADPGRLVETIPLDKTLSPFAARRLRSQLIVDAIALSQVMYTPADQTVLSIDSYLLLLGYDFNRKSYTLCLPQGIYIKKHYPNSDTPYPKYPSVRFMALSTVGNCADKQSMAQINKGQDNRFTFGLYIKLAMDSSAAETVYNAAGGDFAAKKARYTCRNLILTQDYNIVCGKIDTEVGLSGRTLILDMTTNGSKKPQTRWTLK